MTTSFSRVGSANIYDTALRNISNRQSALSNLQESLTSGKRVVRASDDPTGAAQAERALTRISRIATDQRALESQRNAITVAESTLGDVSNALQSFRELVVSAGSGIHTAADRKTIALQLTGLRDQIMSLSNTKDTNGLPGQTASSEVSIPFTLDGDSAFMLQASRDGVYNVISTPASMQLKTGSVSVTNAALVNGSAYTLTVGTIDTTSNPGTTIVTYDVTENPQVTGPFLNQTASYPTGQAANIVVTAMPGLSLSITGTPSFGDSISVSPNSSIFSVLDKAIRDIGSAANNGEATLAVTEALTNIDIGMGRVSAVRGQAGELLNRADRITDSQGKRSIQLEADRSRAEDLDMVKGISDFQKAQTGYQVALQSYAQVQKLSLFNYIS